MAERSDPSQPPSDPRPAIARGGIPSRAAQDRFARTQLGAALLVGLMLVASGLYLWRRPRTPADSAAVGEAAASAASATDDAGGRIIAAADAGSSSPLTLSDTRVVACQDRGPKKTPADQCDHVATLEKALVNAVQQSAACVPESVTTGTIEYVADVSFSRHKVSVVLPRSGRSVRDLKVLGACATVVRSSMYSVPLEGFDHQHARYKISVTATYRHALRGG